MARPKTMDRSPAKPASPAKPVRPVKPSAAVPPPRPKRPSDPGLVPIAEVARPHGIRGELRLAVFNEDSSLLTQGRKVRLWLTDGSDRDVTIVSARHSNKALLVHLSEVADRNAAEALRGAQVVVRRTDFPQLDAGEFYACDLEGARAVLSSGEEVGHVTGIASYPTCDVLVVARGAQTLEIPLTDAYVGSVEPERGLVTLLTIEGLD